MVGMFALAQAAKSGVSGTEFVALLLIPLMMVGLITGIVNVILITRYIRKYKPAPPRKAIGIVIVVLSLLIVCVPGGALVKNYVPWFIDHDGQVERIRGESNQKFKASHVVSLQEATQLLNSCQLNGVSYVELIGQENKNNAETSRTGLVTSDLEIGTPHTLFVSDRMASQVKPIADQAKQNCPNLVILDREGAILNESSQWIYKL